MTFMRDNIDWNTCILWEEKKQSWDNFHLLGKVNKVYGVIISVFGRRVLFELSVYPKALVFLSHQLAWDRARVSKSAQFSCSIS